VAGHERPVRDPRLGGDAPADAGRARDPALRGLAGALADRSIARCRAGRGGAGRVGGPRLQPPSAAPARGMRGRRRARVAAGPRRAARGRAVHGRRACGIRVRARHRRAGHERAAAVQAPGARAGAAAGGGAALQPGDHRARRARRAAVRARSRTTARGTATRSPSGYRRCASRTPTAGCAAAWWRRWPPGRSCPRSSPDGSSARSTGWSATGSSSATGAWSG
jgi:hypothetical protein